MFTIFILTGVGGKGALGQGNPQQTPPDTAKTICDTLAIEEVLVSTGYQTIPKERATGSFSFIDARTIERNPEINLYNRLEGLASGLLVNRELPGARNPAISVRGRSTLFGNAAPLIVIDGFPYEGSIDAINAGDILSISVLKDAAAASIWGTRAANGVLVIETRKGARNQRSTIGASTAVTVGGKPDLYHIPWIDPAEYIELEQQLFQRGYYNTAINRRYTPVPAAVEVMLARRSGSISSVDSAERIDELKGYDVRRDMEKYLYRQRVHRQHQLSVGGGGGHSRYYLSGGYDKSFEQSVSGSYERFTLNASNGFSFWRERVEVNGDVNITSETARSGETFTPFSPYDRLADHEGNHLAVSRDLRLSYIDTAGGGRLLDWAYRPLEETAPVFRTRTNQYRLGVGANVRIRDGLSLTPRYQYLVSAQASDATHPLSGYHARNLINTYSEITGGGVINHIPMGDIAERGTREVITRNARLQAVFGKAYGQHEVNAIAGYEWNHTSGESASHRLYGYDGDTRANGNNTIDPQRFYRLYYGTGTGQLPTAPYGSADVNFTQSYYANFSYGYRGQYFVSGSARRDESNLFGVRSNQKGVPLWSAGVAWILSRAGFLSSVPEGFLKLRATYGYNGNVDRTVSGYLTVRQQGLLNPFGSAYADIINPPNPSLRWEKVGTWNAGLDFALLGKRVSGSVDAYWKNAEDLIGNSPIAMQTGLTQFRGNNASLRNRGLDLVVNTVNLASSFGWTTTFMLNLNRETVTHFGARHGSNLNIVSSNSQNPLEGYPYYAVFSFPSAGLDETGAARGYLNGEVSRDYARIRSLYDPAQLTYHGSGSPTCFGNLLNSLSYGRWELSVNLTYKLGYYFRRTGVFTGSSYGHAVAGYAQRWQRPGDEDRTRIPALFYPNNLARSSFFQYTDDLVERGDHVRLRDLRVQYTWRKAKLFCYAENLPILWRSNGARVDPDFGTGRIPDPFNIAAGIHLTL